MLFSGSPESVCTLVADFLKWNFELKIWNIFTLTAHIFDLLSNIPKILTGVVRKQNSESKSLD